MWSQLDVACCIQDRERFSLLARGTSEIILTILRTLPYDPNDPYYLYYYYVLRTLRAL
jgi:hypothetical protein